VLIDAGYYIGLDIRKPDEAALNRAIGNAAACNAPASYHIDRIVAGTALDALVLAGWAVDGHSGKVARRVEVIAGGHRFITNYGLPRADVASSLGNPAYAASGFDLVVPGGTFSSGDHELRLRVLRADGSCYDEGPPIEFTIR
jgi:hypothetical protein